MDDDFIRAANDHERRMFEEKRRAEERRREARNQLVGYILTAFATVAIVGALIAAIWTANESSGKRTQELRQTCLDLGGNWVKLGSQGDPVCVKISEVDQ